MDRQQPAQAQVWVGIDIGKHAHHAAAVAADGQLVWARRVANDQAAIAEMIGQATASAAGVCWAVDSTCGDNIEIDANADEVAQAIMAAQATVASVRDARKDWSLGSDDRSEVRAMSRANN